ncbi:MULTISPECIES: cytochrome oxidase biogenesis cluster protein [Vibrio diabolicus subgroup]|uniref:cytochrome oxidase biogenesis cluster protein n=1 Tax=Vibrio diabolicus subgroup TaxID=2315253 RepID=UPI00211A1E3F|nr:MULTISPECIES: cytochrome oxidase biogenesis cluster protein [Vibrio diabolicus subgroup]MCQ9049354.1 cytochrome oxidase biogenesis cluster protein [Vibrio diabolicus]MCR9988164.1 cytochrome oxidase biogenesis cluster protein [Vibrio antiquarius]
MTSKVTKGRLMLIALVCTFALPAVIAKVILTQGWYQSGVTNRGVLVEPYTTLELLGQESPLKEHRWQLAYVLPNECTEQCRQQLYLLQQSHVALGKYQERVVPVLWQTELSGTVDISMTTMQMNQSVTAKVKPGQMLIVDPLGQLVMSYSLKPNEDLVSFNKGMLADLRKLLKLSRVG